VKIESHVIPGPAGNLEALLNLPEPEASGGGAWVAVICHPHPLYGGTMHNKVVFHLARALAGLGWPVLRFNFRGVGASGGLLQKEAGAAALLPGAGEDLRAALAWLMTRFPGAPVCGAGFSFGARTVLRIAASEPRLARLLLVGTPAGDEYADTFSLVAHLPQPKLFIQGDADQFGPPDAIRRLFDAAAEPKRLILIAGATHFFEGYLNELRSAAAFIADV